MELVVLCPFTKRAGLGWTRCRGWKPPEGSVVILLISCGRHSLPAPAKFHYESRSLFGSNTAWKLQYTPLHSLEVGKKNVHQIALFAGTEVIHLAHEMCTKVSCAREANTLFQ